MVYESSKTYKYAILEGENFCQKNRKIETEEWGLLYNLCIVIRLTYEKRSKTMKNDRFYVAKGFVSGCERVPFGVRKGSFCKSGQPLWKYKKS